MSYETRLELHPTPDNELVRLTSKIEEVIAQERVELGLSALISAALRLEMCLCDGNEQKAAERLAHALKQIARKSSN